MVYALLFIHLISIISALSDDSSLNLTIKSYPQKWKLLDAEEVIVYDASKVDLAVSEITFKLRNEVNDAEISVDQLAVKPEDIDNLDDVVYTYLSVNQNNIDDANLMYMDLTFKVTKTWLAENNKVNEDLVLYFYLDGQWTQLTTRVHALVDIYVLYKATSFNFGNFAVSFKPVISTKENIEEDITESTKIDVPDISLVKKPKLTEEEPRPVPKTESLKSVSVFLFIVILLVYYYYKRETSDDGIKKKKKKPSDKVKTSPPVEIKKKEPSDKVKTSPPVEIKKKEPSDKVKTSPPVEIKKKEPSNKVKTSPPAEIKKKEPSDKVKTSAPLKPETQNR